MLESVFSCLGCRAYMIMGYEGGLVRPFLLELKGVRLPHEGQLYYLQLGLLTGSDSASRMLY